MMHHISVISPRNFNEDMGLLFATSCRLHAQLGSILHEKTLRRRYVRTHFRILRVISIAITVGLSYSLSDIVLAPQITDSSLPESLTLQSGVGYDPCGNRSG